MTRNRLIASVALACVLYVGCIGAAFAATVDVSWALPAEFDNGAPLNPATDLEAVRVFVDGVEAARLAGTATSARLEVRSGTYEIHATVVSTAASVGEGSESEMSNILVREVVAPKPRPPTLLEAVVAWLKRIFARFA